MSLLSILVVIGIVLLLVGTTQRKKIALIFKSNVKAATDAASDPVKILKFKLEEAKATLTKLVDKSCEIFAQERSLKNKISSFKTKYESAMDKAKSLKAEGKENQAKAKLEIALSVKSEMDILTSQYDAISANRIKIEKMVEKQKVVIEKVKTKTSRIESNIAASDAMKSVSSMLDDLAVDSLPDIEDQTTQELDKQTRKLELIDVDDEEEETSSEDVNSAYDSL